MSTALLSARRESAMGATRMSAGTSPAPLTSTVLIYGENMNAGTILFSDDTLVRGRVYYSWTPTYSLIDGS